MFVYKNCCVKKYLGVKVPTRKNIYVLISVRSFFVYLYIQVFLVKAFVLKKNCVEPVLYKGFSV